MYHPQLHRLVKMAPVFDTGNSLFYNKEIIPQGSNLLDVTVNSFKKKEVSLLEYVSKSDLVGIGKLESFPKEVYNLLTCNTDIPDERAKSISGTVQQKLEYLKLFQQRQKDLEKRKQVFDTAVTYYYNQACRVVEGMRVAEEYRAKANRTVREIRN